MIFGFNRRLKRVEMELADFETVSEYEAEKSQRLDELKALIRSEVAVAIAAGRTELDRVETHVVDRLNRLKLEVAEIKAGPRGAAAAKKWLDSLRALP